ncbi:MAG: type II toxin-antitoxin system HicB family antitoxin [Dehalococcoidia bacterium]|nr:type II toxin-antitoxin system HicB family antitoxin [Dehalococcoidia bacterium]
MADASLDMYMNWSYAVEVVPDECTDGTLCYRANHPELPGCTSHGDTPEEAIQNLEDARRLYIETLLEKGIDIPLPRTKTSAIWTVLSPRPLGSVQPQLPGVEESPKYTEARILSPR